MSLTILIPCKNEELIIEDTVSILLDEFNKTQIEFEIILINDFSTDQTETNLAKLQKENNKVVYLNNNISGIGNVITTGIQNAKNEFLVIFMSDMSDDIEDLKKYYYTIKDENIDCVFGSRFSKESKIVNYPIFKYILNRIFNIFVKIIFFSNYNDFTNAFKIYKVSTLKKLLPIVSENFNTFLELPLKIISRKYKYKVIPINWYNRKKGKSKFNIKELSSKYIFTLIYCFLEKNLLKKRK